MVLGEQKRGAQFETAGLLRMGDGDGSPEDFLGGGRVRRIALEQDLAAEAVQKGVTGPLSRLARQSQSFVDPAQSAFGVGPFCFEFGGQALKERDSPPVAQVDVCGQGASQFRYFDFAEPGARPI